MSIIDEKFTYKRWISYSNVSLIPLHSWAKDVTQPDKSWNETEKMWTFD